MVKILFIVPPHISINDFLSPAFNARSVAKGNGTYGSVLTEMPLGVLSMSAFLKGHHEVETALVDFNIILNKLDEFPYQSFAGLYQDVLSSDTWSSFAPDIVSISSLFTPSYRNLLDIARCCREVFPDSLIVAGGGVPMNMHRQLFSECESIDAVCHGEGEKPLLGLVTADDRRQFLRQSPSWITAEKSGTVGQFTYDFVEELDDIPFYDYGICEIEEYGRNPALTAYASIGDKSRSFHVMTSRGCTLRCCFCSSHKVHGRRMRYFSVDRVRQDFTRLRDQYGARTLVFQDDHLLADRNRALAIIDVVKELGLSAVFQNGLALYALDRKMLEALKSAGIEQLLLSVESGSDRVLREVMHKPLDLSIVRRVAADCRDLGIYTNVNILIGLPGETKADIEEARDFLGTLDANWFLVFCATPLVGSEMFEICLEKGYFKGNYLDTDYKKAIVETEEFTAEYIQEKAYLLNLELNFVGNSDYRLGHYESALKGFENAIRAKSDHAVAYFCAARCYQKLGDPEKAGIYLEIAKKICAADPFWRRHADLLNIPL